MAVLSKEEFREYNLEKYQYETDVQKSRQLYGMSGKMIYNGKWMSRRTEKIIIIEMNEVIAEREARFYLEVNGHENVIRTLGFVENSLNLTIFIQEFAEHNDLAGILMDNQFNLSQTILIEMFAQIADAMSYVASRNIVHGDLGCRNVLVFRVDPSEPKNNLVKLTDFGLARWIDRPPTNEDPTVIPIRYCAPEVLRNTSHASYSEKSDVYSMGVLIWEALSNGEIPYSSIAKDEDVKKKKLNNERLPQPEVCDLQLWILMNECWDNNRKPRPTFESIKERLANIEVSEITNWRSSVLLYELPQHYEYKLDVNVRMKGLLNGYFGETYAAEWISRKEQPIVLIVVEQEIAENEAQVYNDFDPHPYIVYTFGFVGNDHGLTLLLQERTPNNNLQTLLHSREFQPSAKVLVTIFLQIVEAMMYVVSQGILHGDLRCGNVIVFHMHPSEPTENLVKLTNFGLARRNDPLFTDDRRLAFPVRYCAPEILRSAGRSNYSELSDVYSMGVLMWEACSRGKIPYESSITNGEVRQRKLQGEKLPRPLICDEQVWPIMADCWHNEPQLRFEFQDMKTRFSKINLKDVDPYQYELNKNVKENRSLGDMNGRFYEAEWIPKRNEPILLYVIDGPTAEDEAMLYIKFSSHPHILHTYGRVKNDHQSLMLLQEQARYGNLQGLLQSGNFQPSPNVIVAIFLQIVDAMIYISSQDVVHGDLRCANILVFQMDSSEPTANLVKLTNFSSARTKNEPVANSRLPDGYIRYCAPEILRNEDGSTYTELSDVYSMGVLMCEACSKGEVAYGHLTSDRDVRQQRLNNMKLPRPHVCDNQIWSVIEDCCYNEPNLRWNFEQLKIQLGKIDIKPIPLLHCDRCNNSIRENEMAYHQQSCVLPMPRMDDIDLSSDDFSEPGSYIEKYADSDEDSHSVSNSQEHPPRVVATRNDSDESDVHRPIKTPEPSPIIQQNYPSCKYCGDFYPDCLIEEHETLHCRRRPNKSIVTRQPTPIHNETTVNKDTIDDWRTHRPPPPPRSFWARICPCLRF